MSNILRYNGYFAKIEFDADDNIFFGQLADIKDGVSFHADTVKELVTAFEEAVDDYIETCARIGKAPERPYSGKIMLRVDPAVHQRAMLAAQIAGVSLNQFGEDALRKAASQIAGPHSDDRAGDLK